jgi:hypothetical protein
MLYATNISQRATLRFPVNYGRGSVPAEPVVSLKGTTSRKEYEVALAVVECSKLVLVADADLSALESGEYEYTLPGVSSGLLMVLDEAGIKQYHNITQYDQYEQ